MCFVGSSCFIYVICIYVLVSNTIPFQMMFVSFNSNMTVSLVEQITLPEHLSSAPVYSGVRIARSFVFFVVFCRSLLVHLSFFFWPLYFLSCDVRLLKLFLYKDLNFTIWYLFLYFICHLHKSSILTYKNIYQAIYIYVSHSSKLIPSQHSWFLSWKKSQILDIHRNSIFYLFFVFCLSLNIY